MTAAGAWAIVCGVALGLGLWSMIAIVPRLSRPSLADRVAPYLVDVSEEARELTARKPVHPLPVVGAVLQPIWDGARGIISRSIGGGETIAVRLRQSGTTSSVEDFRSRQLVWAVAGFVVGAALAVALATSRPVPVIVLIALPVVIAATAFTARDWLLRRSARARLRRIAAEFPTVVEFLTLSLSAGEGILDAVRRVARTSSGELAREFASAVAEVNTGIPLTTALGDIARNLRLPALSRCIDAITTALERGTPLAEVLRAQASDSRAEAKRDLLESAGKKEVAMLVPLVFLILPCTVLFAIFPGVFVLQSGF